MNRRVNWLSLPRFLRFVVDGVRTEVNYFNRPELYFNALCHADDGRLQYPEVDTHQGKPGSHVGTLSSDGASITTGRDVHFAQIVQGGEVVQHFDVNDPSTGITLALSDDDSRRLVLILEAGVRIEIEPNPEVRVDYWHPRVANTRNVYRPSNPPTPRTDCLGIAVRSHKQLAFGPN